jgi:hypothetical protein
MGDMTLFWLFAAVIVCRRRKFVDEIQNKRKEAFQVIYGREQNSSQEADPPTSKDSKAVLSNTRSIDVFSFSSSISVFPRHYHSASAPYSFIYHPQEGKWTRHRTQFDKRFLIPPEEQK